MRDETNDHFFACYLVWVELRVALWRLETLLEVDELTERVDEALCRQEEIGAWLMDELIRAKAGYLYKGQRVSLLKIDGDELERRLSESLKSLEELAVSLAPDGVAAAGLAYLAECAWAATVMRNFTELESTLSDTGASPPFADMAAEFATQILWLEAQQAELVAQVAMPADRLNALTGAVESLAREWREMVFAYSDRYPRPVA